MPLTSRLMARRGSDKKALHSIENLVGITGLFMSMIIGLQAASFGGLATVLGALAAAATVAIGFGMRDQVSSVVAGVFIHTDNPFVKGDYIKVDGMEGKVKEIRLRATKLKYGGTERIVPNNVLTTKTVENLSRGTRTASRVEVKIPGDRAEKAESILGKVLDEQDEVLEKPAPSIRHEGIEEGQVRLVAEFSAKESTDLSQAKSGVIRAFNDRAWRKNVYEKE